MFGNLASHLSNTFNTESYFRDEVGNIFAQEDKQDRTYGKGGQLQQMQGAQYEYDEEGFLTRKTQQDGKTWHYHWQGNGMLKQVIRPDKKTVQFEYDALGRRTAKIFDNSITRWVWDGNTPLHEWKYDLNDRPKPVVDEFGQITKDKAEPTENLITWIFDEGSFRPAAKIAGKQRYSIITDYLGTPKEAYDTWGNKIWEIELEAYGKVRSCSGDKSFIPFRFQGQYHDEETGLYYNRFRYYSPEEGMYVTAQDPIRLMGGDKFYSYVHDPNAWLDALGLTGHPFPEIRDQVSQIISEQVEAIKKIDADAIVGFRGSIASGVKGAHKGNLPFDPSNFDVDGFIVSDEMAKKYSKSQWFRSAGNKFPVIKKLERTLEKTFQGAFPGYRLPKKGQTGFSFRIFTTAEYNKKKNGSIICK